MSELAEKPAKAKKRVYKNLTWEHPKGSGIKIAEMPNVTAGRAYGVSYQIRIPAKLVSEGGGKEAKREVHQCKTKAEAERLAEDRLLVLRKFGTSFSSLPASAQRGAAIAWGMLKEHNIDLIEAARAAIAYLRPAGGHKKVRDVVSELLLSKETRWKAGKLDKRTPDTFRSITNAINPALGDRLIHEFTAEDLKAWLGGLLKGGVSGKGKPLSHRTVMNYRNVLSEIFGYAAIKQYSSSNPFDRFTAEDYKAFGGEKPEQDIDSVRVLSLTVVEKLLATACLPQHQRLLPSLLFRLFCGIRSTEINKVDWKHVRWDQTKPYIHISASVAKKRRIRHVEIPANVMSWLWMMDIPESGPVVPGPVSIKVYTNRFAALVKDAGIGKPTAGGEWESDWEGNDTRHSFGSYHYALYGDSVKTSTQMGHKQGDDILFAHYRTLVTKEDAEKYFSLKPNAQQTTALLLNKARPAVSAATTPPSAERTGTSVA